MTRTQRISERNDFINERIRQCAYKAFYQYHLKETERGTVFKSLNNGFLSNTQETITLKLI